jgi:hypothetical protein
VKRIENREKRSGGETPRSFSSTGVSGSGGKAVIGLSKESEGVCSRLSSSELFKLPGFFCLRFLKVESSI